MKKRTVVASLAAMSLLLTLSLSNAYADGGQCRFGGGGDRLGGMFFKKAHTILENKDALGLTADKAAEIKGLQLETAKAIIKQRAEIATVSVDLRSKLHEDPVNIEAVNKLVDQQFDLKKAKTKTMVEAFAKLKGLLTQEQYDKLRELWKSGKGKEFRRSHEFHGKR